MKQFNIDRGIVYGFLIIVIIWWGSFPLFTHFFPDVSKSWAFWDTFWAINSLFSGLAFLWIIYTILLQRQELKFQREELEMTRKELEKTAKAQEQQVDIQIDLAKLTAYSALLDSANKPRRENDLTSINFLWYSWTQFESEIKDILNKLK